MARKKKTVSFSLDPELMARLSAWCEKQPAQPTKTAAVEAAIRRFLDADKKSRADT